MKPKVLKKLTLLTYKKIMIILLRILLETYHESKYKSYLRILIIIWFFNVTYNKSWPSTVQSNKNTFLLLI